MTRSALAALAILSALPAAAQPVVGALQNNYSYALPGTPNYGIARGSIFILYGTGVGPASLQSQNASNGLNRNLGGVSVKVTVGGVTTEAIPYYVSATQIGAILPSATPAGDGTITVTYNGQTSAPKPIKVVDGAFGIMSFSGAGNGTATVHDANFNFINLTAAANPGQTVIFWGTGLGPTTTDETRLITPTALNASIEFYIGGKLANVAFRGRSAFPGLDQINVVIPDGVSGCYVAAYIKTGSYTSNFVTIPVATNGRVCTEPNGLSAADVERVLSGQSISSGWLYLGRFVSSQPAIVSGSITIPAIRSTTDSATAQFLRYTPFDFSNYGGQGQASLGSCVVSAFRSDAVFTPPFQRTLEAGTVRLQMPDSSTRNLTRGAVGNHFLTASDIVPNETPFIPPGGGQFQFSNTGGADIGVFQTSLTVSPPFTWTNEKTLEATNINRGSNLELTWTNGMPNSYMWITGSSSNGATPVSLITAFNCTVDAAAGRFTIPSAVLSALMPSFTVAGSTMPTGQLAIANYAYPSSFSAPGLDAGMKAVMHSYSILVNYR